ncbi:3 -5 exonuclease helicase [Niveomyces insectorum RCEF 264]|uniref:3-5 exonuclease helicase n=1 Tax=Niveomyces insectorum RCEF 264 TaxID=1081102 RepID=A0A167MFS8_9HYPO|nr:3 -5 exonuclease helicase [Niveomyces insectorum RCEF 264]
MGRHGASLQRLHELVPVFYAILPIHAVTRSHALPLRRRPQRARRRFTTRICRHLHASLSLSYRTKLPTRLPTASMGSQQHRPMPANWHLWRPDDTIVFGSPATGPPAAAAVSIPSTSTADAPSRAVFQQARVRASLLQSAVRATIVTQYNNTATAVRSIHTTAVPENNRETGWGDTVSKSERVRVVGHEQTAQLGGAVESEENVVETTNNDDKADDDSADAENQEAEVSPPVTTLAYNMPEDLFRAARNAPLGTPASFWSYTLYRKNAVAVENAATVSSTSNDTHVKVHYCKSKHTTERVCTQYFADEPLLGFDLEWMYDATRWQGPRRNVCLVQLASPSRIGLFHLAVYPGQDDLVAPALRRILEDPAVLKTGVAIKGDATRLRTFLRVEMRGMLELSHLHKLVKYSRTGEVRLVNKKLVPLAAQVAEHLRLPMFKGHDVRAGDWSKPLNMDQIIYSASDAYAAVQIYSVLEKQRQELTPAPPRPAFAELNLPIKLADGGILATPTPDDAVEKKDLDEEKDSADIGGSPAKLRPDFLAAARADVQMEADGGGDSMTSTKRAGTTTPQRKQQSTPTKKKPGTPSSSSLSPSPSSPSPQPNDKDARILAADAWLAQYRACGQTVRARPSSLRAYHLWHEQDGMGPVEVARLLREPPLQTSTVVGYILDALRLEGLPYHKTRLRMELLAQLPPHVVLMRYAGLARACGYVSNNAKTAHGTSSAGASNGSSV